MQLGQPRKERLALVCQVDKDLAAIFCAAFAAYQAMADGAINQPHDAVLAHLKPVRQFRDGGKIPMGKPLDGKQQLVLLRRDVLATRRLLAETEKAADGIAK